MKRWFMCSVWTLLMCVSLSTLALAQREILIANACTFPITVSLSHELLDAPYDLGTIAPGDALPFTVEVEHGWTITVLDDNEGAIEKGDFSFAAGKQFIVEESGNIAVSRR